MPPPTVKRTLVMWRCKNCNSVPSIKQSKKNPRKSTCDCSDKMTCVEHKYCSKCGKPHTLEQLPEGSCIVGWMVAVDDYFVYDVTDYHIITDTETEKLFVY